MPKTDTDDAGRRPHVRASTCSGAPLHRTVALHHCVASAGSGTLPATSPSDEAPMRRFLAVYLFLPACLLGLTAVPGLNPAHGGRADPFDGAFPDRMRAAATVESGRSEERRVGEECGSTCRSRWSPSH